MSHAVPVSDEDYRKLAKLAQQSVEWAAGIDEALRCARRGENPVYDDMEVFFSALDESLEEDDNR